MTDADGFEIETSLNLRALRSGLNVAEIPSFEANRVSGESKLRALPDGMRVLRTIFSEWIDASRSTLQKNFSKSLEKR
jgi:hypothetical protein